jgi:hypothetical protein
MTTTNQMTTKETKSEIKTIKIKLKDLKDNPYHSRAYDKEQIKKLETSIRNLGILRSFSGFVKGKDIMLVCGHHTREAAINVLGKNTEVDVTIQPYDNDLAVWGMSTENLTQMGDEKRRIEDLVSIRKYLKNTFKNYQEFVDFMKKKGISGVVISDSRIKRAEQHYTQLGSSRQISEWLNRKGVIMDFHEISELLRIKDNLSPELYEKMVVGQTNKSKDKKGEDDEDEELVFNLTNAKMLSSLGNDYNEQKEVLNALENSNEERMHRVRTRGKVLTKYKELKKASETGKIKVKGQEVSLDEEDKKKLKESIKLIREGKKDIGNIDLPNIKLPQNITEITIQEINMELQDDFYHISNKLSDYLDKDNLSRCSNSELGKMIFYLNSFMREKFVPFYKELFKELIKRKKAETEKDKKNGSDNVIDLKGLRVINFNESDLKGGNDL